MHKLWQNKCPTYRLEAIDVATLRFGQNEDRWCRAINSGAEWLIVTSSARGHLKYGEMGAITGGRIMIHYFLSVFALPADQMVGIALCQ